MSEKINIVSGGKLIAPPVDNIRDYIIDGYTKKDEQRFLSPFIFYMAYSLCTMAASAINMVSTSKTLKKENKITKIIIDIDNDADIILLPVQVNMSNNMKFNNSLKIMHKNTSSRLTIYIDNINSLIGQSIKMTFVAISDDNNVLDSSEFNGLSSIKAQNRIYSKDIPEININLDFSANNNSQRLMFRSCKVNDDYIAVKNDTNIEQYSMSYALFAPYSQSSAPKFGMCFVTNSFPKVSGEKIHAKLIFTPSSLQSNKNLSGNDFFIQENSIDYGIGVSRAKVAILDHWLLMNSSFDKNYLYQERSPLLFLTMVASALILGTSAYNLYKKNTEENRLSKIDLTHTFTITNCLPNCCILVTKVTKNYMIPSPIIEPGCIFVSPHALPNDKYNILYVNLILKFNNYGNEENDNSNIMNLAIHIVANTRGDQYVRLSGILDKTTGMVLSEFESSDPSKVVKGDDIQYLRLPITPPDKKEKRYFTISMNSNTFLKDGNIDIIFM